MSGFYLFFYDGPTILLNSLVPVYFVTRFDLFDFISGKKRRLGKQVSGRLMLVFQLAVSVTLISFTNRARA